MIQLPEFQGRFRFKYEWETKSYCLIIRFDAENKTYDLKLPITIEAVEHIIRFIGEKVPR